MDNFSVGHREVISKGTLCVAVVFCILAIFDNEEEMSQRRASYESERLKWVYWSIQVEFFDTN